MVGNDAWNSYARENLEKQFPKLTPSSYALTSPDTIDYNCVAWAAESDEEWWWPDPMEQEYWPDGIPREETLSAFIAAFRTIGYESCDSSALKPEIQKIAIYADAQGIPRHIARQLPDGQWTSKIGQCEDIQHQILDVLTGSAPAYGKVVQIMQKPIN
ncbi:MAG: hypothetical protein VKJ64_13875 [Leptolyngbyaceae bacterium]|nr:hypothetical protein [Leptolyngbyaceae bacterium]